MKKEKRDLLFVKKNRELATADNLEITLCDILSEGQWNVHIAYSISEANTLVKEHQFHTGLALVESLDDQPYLDRLKYLFEYNSCTYWVMLLPPLMSYNSNTCNSSEKKLITDFCYDYLSLPVDKNRLLFALGHAYGMSELNRRPFENISDYPAFHGIIGNSSLMKDVFKKIDKVAPEHCSVLINGETGTGKELVAKAIHDRSDRAEKPFIVVNCGAIPKDLIQAELFGYEKGAFTGAYQRKKGRIESAEGGTLFLDEIGDLPLAQQVNLLRFLEQKTIERIGGIDKIPVDVRVIAATHVNLEQAVKSLYFREDLYYRLRVLHITVPPLRNRDNDTELIAWYFFHKFSTGHKQKPRGFSMDALSTIHQYSWPGNVRELYNCIMQGIIMSDNRLLSASDLGLERRSINRKLSTLEESRDNADKEVIKSSLIKNNYNMTHAAKQLNISRVTLYRLIKKYQVSV